MTLLLFPCHSKESHRKVDDEESKIHSFMLFEILHSASLHSEWHFIFSPLSFWGIRQKANDEESKKQFFLFLRDSSSPSASQNDTSAFSLSFWGDRRKVDDEESENNPLFLIDSSFRFASFRMTFYFFPFVILRNSLKGEWRRI